MLANKVWSLTKGLSVIYYTYEILLWAWLIAHLFVVINHSGALVRPRVNGMILNLGGARAGQGVGAATMGLKRKLRGECRLRGRRPAVIIIVRSERLRRARNGQAYRKVWTKNRWKDLQINHNPSSRFKIVPHLLYCSMRNEMGGRIAFVFGTLLKQHTTI